MIGESLDKLLEFKDTKEKYVEGIIVGGLLTPVFYAIGGSLLIPLFPETKELVNEGMIYSMMVSPSIVFGAGFYDRITKPIPERLEDIGHCAHGI